jgi:hypothetical protein
MTTRTAGIPRLTPTSSTIPTTIPGARRRTRWIPSAGGQTSGGVLSDDEDGGHAASPKAMGAINPSFGVSSMATKSPSTAAQFSGFVSGGGKSLPGRQSPHPWFLLRRV